MANATDISSQEIFDRAIDTVASKVLLSVISHPICLVRTLIQLGYEPLPPVDAKSFLTGRPIKLLPNVFTYIKYIYNVDGFLGCFKGLSSRIWFSIFSAVGYCSVIIKNVENIEADLRAHDNNALLKWELVATAASTIISHPFFIISIRQMAQFIGKEDTYDYGVLNSLLVIAREESVFGWFNGLSLRLFEELFTVLFVYLVVHIFNDILEAPRPHQPLIYLITVYLVSGYMYPFKLTGVRMAVNNSGLKGGSPPFMPNYNGSWSMCYDDLLKNGQIYNGAALFRRPYIPPSSMSNYIPNESVKLYKLNLGTIKQVFRTLL